MSVRQSKRTDPKTGKVTRILDVDRTIKTPDGGKKRVRKRLLNVSKRYAEEYERQMVKVFDRN